MLSDQDTGGDCLAESMEVHSEIGEVKAEEAVLVEMRIADTVATDSCSS